MNTKRIAKTLTRFFSTFTRSSLLGNAALVAICATLFASPQALAQSVIFTRSTLNGEGWAAYSATFTPTQSGNYTLSFNIVSFPGRDSTIFLDDVRVSSGSADLFRSGFESPAVGLNSWLYPTGPSIGQATSPPWTYTNYSGVINGNPSIWGGLGPEEGSQRGFVQAYSGTLSNIKTSSALSLVAFQSYTVTFFQASRPGTVGDEGTLTYTVEFDRVAAPVISSVTPSSDTLWPPNHQMVPITLNVVATGGAGVTSSIISVTSSEPDNGLGDGNTTNDIQITGPLTVNLRAERSGTGGGRTYTITVQASDADGNLSVPKSTTVFVPKSQGRK